MRSFESLTLQCTHGTAAYTEAFVENSAADKVLCLLLACEPMLCLAYMSMLGCIASFADILEPVVGGSGQRKAPRADHSWQQVAAHAVDQQRAEHKQVPSRDKRQPGVEQREGTPPQQVTVRGALHAC